MGLERSRRPGILNLQSFRGSETLLRGINILPEFAIFPLRFYGELGGRSFAHVCATHRPQAAGLRKKVPPQRFQLLVLRKTHMLR